MRTRGPLRIGARFTPAAAKGANPASGENRLFGPHLCRSQGGCGILPQLSSRSFACSVTSQKSKLTERYKAFFRITCPGDREW